MNKNKLLNKTKMKIKKFCKKSLSYYSIYFYVLSILFKGFFLFGFFNFLFKNVSTSLCLNKDKINRQSSENIILTSLKYCLKNSVILLLIFKLFYLFIN